MVKDIYMILFYVLILPRFVRECTKAKFLAHFNFFKLVNMKSMSILAAMLLIMHSIVAR